MAGQSPLPIASGSSGRQGGALRAGPAAFAPASLVSAVVMIAGTALLGAAAGLGWSAVAPRALLVVVSRGSANVVNPETTAYVAADGWFVLVTALGGIVSGLLGYALAVRRHGALAAAGVLIGGLAAALIARWIGQWSGAAAFNHSLVVSRPGVLLRAPLTLGGQGTLAFWPLAAGLTVGAIEAVILLSERRQRPR